MTTRYSLADVASLIGEPTRSAVLLALVDGSERPASELARMADLSAAATSLHLSKLVAGGLLAVRSLGRFRFYRLASSDVAHALEALGVLATVAPPERSLSKAQMQLRTARRCYDHLAGRLAIEAVLMMERQKILSAGDEAGWYVTERGVTWFASTLQLEVDVLRTSRRPLARRCLDWTERKPHLAGTLGAALLDRLLAKRWLARVGDTRGLRMTTRGESELHALGWR